MVTAPALLRFASRPCPKARQTSASINPFISAAAEAWVFAASRCSSQSYAADAHSLLPSKQISRVPTGFGADGGTTGTGSLPGHHAVPELLLSIEELQLVKPVGRDLRNSYL